MYKWHFFFLTLIVNWNSYSSGRFSTEKWEVNIEKVDFRTHTDTVKSLTTAVESLKKAKNLKDWTTIALTYKQIIFFSEKKNVLKYADSMVMAALHTKNKELIGSAYLKKGILYYEVKQHRKALDNYIIADGYISRTSDEYLIYKVKFAIAQTKYYLGFYDESISLLKECIEFFKEENDRAYINSLHSLALCYNRIGNYKICDEINRLGIQKAKEFDIPKMNTYFIHSQGINEYSKKNYWEAIRNLNTTLHPLAANKDFANETIAQFYIAKSYYALNQIDIALPHLLKVDKAFVEKKYIRPDLRENYELLIKYYESKNDKVRQLVYINRLLEADRILTQNYKYLSRKIFKEYDTKKLLITRQKIEDAMRLRSILLAVIIAFLIIVIVIVLYKHQKNKQRYRELMNRNPEEIKNKIKNSRKTVLDINPDVAEEILKNLEKFEKNKKYLEKDMSLIKIASLLNTNSKYSSQIIVHYRGKKSIDYINDLKIDYIVERIKTESKFRKYKNKALGEEAGFGTTQNFTKAFNKRTGISPTYFIHKIRKECLTDK